MALECSGGPRQLETCEAASSHPWAVETGEARVNITVNTTAGRGDILIHSLGESSRNLEIIFISGLYPSQGLTFTLQTEGGQPVVARECGETDSSVCWSPQQDLVLLRNIKTSITAINRIEWDADAGSSSSSTTTITSTTNTTNTTISTTTTATTE